MQWTTERPKVEGFYWHKDNKRSFITYVHELNGTWSYDLDSNLTFWDSTRIEMFAGPLTMPPSTSPEWTRKEPTVGGFYWAKGNKRNEFYLMCYPDKTWVVYVRKFGSAWTYEISNKYEGSCPEKINFWAGPLPEPEG